MRDASHIRNWVRGARPGDATVYARGEALPRPIAAAAAQMAEAGLVDLTRCRDGGGGWRYVMQRRSAPYALAEDRRRGRQFGRATPETIILRMIRDAVRRRRPCPTNAEFAEAAGLSGSVSASYRLRKLVAAGKIVLVDHGPFERRVAVLVETGGRTARAPL